jgi:CRP-like cAMP-binding protein
MTQKKGLGNRLLDSLPPPSLKALEPYLERTRLEAGDVLCEPWEPFRHVYFPTEGLVSVLATTIDGGNLEVRLVGFEGMIGIPVVLGATSPYKVLVQIKGSGFRITASAFAGFFARPSGLQSLVLRYTHAVLVQIAQSSVCNHFHSIVQRLCRWLLHARDRSRSDRLPLTQDLLSRMLGIRRASVTVAASMLQRSGMIRTGRGEITILDRRRLESATCECYHVIRDQFERVLKR